MRYRVITLGSHTRCVTGLAFALALAGCGDSVGPASELSVYVSATPDFLAWGDTVELIGMAHNGSNVTIPAGAGCGPGIGFLVADSSGTETDLYSGLGWTCPLRDSNEVEAGETDAVEWSWIPPEVGLYRVRSFVHVRDGPTIISVPAEVRVIDP